MALINCPECGKQISDKAKTCIGCGFPIENYIKEWAEFEAIEKPELLPETALTCMNCGYTTTDDISGCPKCGGMGRLREVTLTKNMAKNGLMMAEYQKKVEAFQQKSKYLNEVPVEDSYDIKDNVSIPEEKEDTVVDMPQPVEELETNAVDMPELLPEMALTCMNCGYTTTDDISSCPKCGGMGRLREVTLTKNKAKNSLILAEYEKAQKDKTAKKIKICENCNYIGSENESFCPNCGKQLKTTTDVDSNIVRNSDEKLPDTEPDSTKNEIKKDESSSQKTSPKGSDLGPLTAYSYHQLKQMISKHTLKNVITVPEDCVLSGYCYKQDNLVAKVYTNQKNNKKFVMFAPAGTSLSWDNDIRPEPISKNSTSRNSTTAKSTSAPNTVTPAKSPTDTQTNSKKKRNAGLGCGTALLIVVALIIIGFMACSHDSDDTPTPTVDTENNTTATDNTEQTEVLSGDEYFVRDLAAVSNEDVANSALEIMKDELGFSDVSFGKQIEGTYNYELNADGYIVYMTWIEDDDLRFFIPDMMVLYEDNEVKATKDDIDDSVISYDEQSSYIIIAQTIVEDNLKNPNSADFPGMYSGEYGMAKDGDLVAVQGTVNAENSVGGHVTEDFLVEFRVNDLNSFDYEVVYVQVGSDSSGDFIEIQ